MNQLQSAIRSTFALRSRGSPQPPPPPFPLEASPRFFGTRRGLSRRSRSSRPSRRTRLPIRSFGLRTLVASRPVYAKLFGMSRHTLKTDIVNLLEGCNLTPDDVRFNYNRMFVPMGMMLQFPSRFQFDQAFKVIGRKGRLYKLERADRSQWDLLMNYDGKTLLLQGIPFSANPNDVERFMSGCQYDASSIQMMVRPANPDPIKMATVNFPRRFKQ